MNDTGFSAVVNEFNKASYANYGNYGFSSGYLGSMISRMAELLTPADREQFMLKLQRETFEQDKQANFRYNKIAA